MSSFLQIDKRDLTLQGAANWRKNACGLSNWSSINEYVRYAVMTVGATVAYSLSATEPKAFKEKGKDEIRGLITFVLLKILVYKFEMLLAPAYFRTKSGV